MKRKAEFEVGWLPPATVRGNTRKHGFERAGKVAEIRASGYAHGLEWLVNGGLPLGAPYAAEVRAFIKGRRRIDADNLLMGYKAFWDGLEDANVIGNDKDIEDMRVRVFYGAESDKSEISVWEAWT